MRACTSGCDREVALTACERVDRISEQAIAYFYHRYWSAVIAGKRVMSRKKRVYHRQVITGINRSLHRPAAFNMEHACPGGKHARRCAAMRATDQAETDRHISSRNEIRTFSAYAKDGIGIPCTSINLDIPFL